MTQNVILQAYDLERLRSSFEGLRFSIRSPSLPISTCVKFHQNLISSFSVTGFPIVDRKMVKRKKKMYIHVLT